MQSVPESLTNKHMHSSPLLDSAIVWFLDPSQRLSVRAAARHEFLTFGSQGSKSASSAVSDVLANTSAESFRTDAEGVEACAEARRVELVPMELHAGPPIRLRMAPGYNGTLGSVAGPQRYGGAPATGDGGDDKDADADQWRRRQLSMLWAPMPTEVGIASRILHHKRICVSFKGNHTSFISLVYQHYLTIFARNGQQSIACQCESE